MSRRPVTWFVVAGLAVVVLLVAFVAPHASSSPDGLEKVAADQRIDESSRSHAMADSPLAGYGVEGIDDGSSGTVIAGLIGVTVVFVLTVGGVVLARTAGRRRPMSPG